MPGCCQCLPQSPAGWRRAGQCLGSAPHMASCQLHDTHIAVSTSSSARSSSNASVTARSSSYECIGSPLWATLCARWMASCQSEVGGYEEPPRLPGESIDRLSMQYILYVCWHGRDSMATLSPLWLSLGTCAAHFSGSATRTMARNSSSPAQVKACKLSLLTSTFFSLPQACPRISRMCCTCCDVPVTVSRFTGLSPCTMAQIPTRQRILASQNLCR